jgi:hypothetical protein
LPSFELHTRTLGTIQLLFCGRIVIVEIGTLGTVGTLENRVVLRREQFQCPYCTHRGTRLCNNFGLALIWTVHQNTRNMPAIVMWWYHANSSDRNTWCSWNPGTVPFREQLY